MRERERERERERVGGVYPHFSLSISEAVSTTIAAVQTQLNQLVVGTDLVRHRPTPGRSDEQPGEGA